MNNISLKSSPGCYATLPTVQDTFSTNTRPDQLHHLATNFADLLSAYIHYNTLAGNPSLEPVERCQVVH